MNRGTSHHRRLFIPTTSTTHTHTHSHSPTHTRAMYTLIRDTMTLYTMSRCDRLVLSQVTGSVSWWAAYLKKAQNADATAKAELYCYFVVLQSRYFLSSQNHIYDIIYISYK